MSIPFRPLTLAFASFALLLAGCTVLEGERIDYRSASKSPSLEIPPDLSTLSRDSSYAIPGAGVMASTYNAGQGSTPGVPVAATSLGDVRIERAGSQRWLVVDRPADQLWSPVRDFWKENGFLLSI
ncbi:MAG: outer membrane protein assembly factor BamC, partial [Burkholderiaceae bacterium]